MDLDVGADVDPIKDAQRQLKASVVARWQHAEVEESSKKSRGDGGR